ncbi:hypothetical protein NQZ68_025124 [Dissostichus eleginoides]|nr:hypothetical protein NQZ68_025124 [Dissostichus eleginoides]
MDQIIEPAESSPVQCETDPTPRNTIVVYGDKTYTLGFLQPEELPLSVQCETDPTPFRNKVVVYGDKNDIVRCETNTTGSG